MVTSFLLIRNPINLKDFRGYYDFDNKKFRIHSVVPANT